LSIPIADGSQAADPPVVLFAAPPLVLAVPPLPVVPPWLVVPPLLPVVPPCVPVPVPFAVPPLLFVVPPWFVVLELLPPEFDAPPAPVPPLLELQANKAEVRPVSTRRYEKRELSFIVILRRTVLTHDPGFSPNNPTIC
jgi:hypothetical protein